MTIDEVIQRYVDNAKYERTHGNLQGCLEFRQLAKWLKELKQLSEQTKWIPCSERLPGDRRAVLVTAYWHETYQVMMASYFGDRLWWCVPFNNSGEPMQKLKPKAWMPLPASYQGEITATNLTVNKE